MQNKRIVFMGSPLIASEYLQILIQNKYNIIGVYTQPPRPKGRGMTIQKCPVHNEALKNKLEIYHPKNFNDKKTIDTFINLKPDFVVVMAYGILLPEVILDKPQYGFINIHVSLLPKWRGASPIEHALLNGDKKTGVSIFRLINKLDSGPILSQSSLMIENNINKDDLTNKLKEIGKDLLIQTLPDYINNKISLKIQNEEEATYARKISTELTRIDFYNNVIRVFNKVRAFSTKPGAWFMFKNERIKIISCKFSLKESVPSTIMNKEFHIGCTDGIIEPRIVQREGKKPIFIGEFIKGFRFSVGEKVNA